MTPDTFARDGIELRPWAMDDLDDLIDACNDPDIARWLPLIPSPYTDEAGRWWVEEGAPQAWRQGGAAFCIVFPGTRKVLGGIGINTVQPGRNQAEVGYWIAPWARGQGVATRATRAISRWAFESGFHRLELLAAKENWASQRVAMAAGFTREGGPTRDGGRQDLVCFVRLATDPDRPIARILPDLPGGHLTDGIVRLRPLRTDDVDDYVALNRLPEVIDTSFGPLITPEVAWERAAWVQNNWLAGDRAECVIEDAVTGAFAGSIGLYYKDQPLSEAMIGYSLHPEFRGKGIATRSVNLLCRWAFENVGIARIIAGTFPENRASQRVLERAGFTREGYLKAALPGRNGARIDDIRFVRLNPNLGG
ncbi:MAG TPA: GNAT family N-acetyltransferase [Candidatus Limnocylindrales bacterium]|nr:GNAT family N-acetyltransferase [Candidatus Limnocylindrales bacterium]